MIFQPQGIH